MDINLINIIVYIPSDKGLSLVNTNIQHNLEYKEQLDPIPDEILEIIDLEGLANFLKYIMSTITENKDKPKADLILAKKIMDFLGNIDIKTAASSEFWNGITLCSDSIYDYITWRWKDYKKYKFFKRSIPIDKKKHSERIKRYITTSSISAIRKQTLARVWWAVKLFSVAHQDLLWKQQDTVDRILENSFGALDKTGNINDIISLFIICYKDLDAIGKFDSNREAKIRSIISWLKLYEDLVFIDNLDREHIKEDIKKIFESIIAQVDQPKIRTIKTDSGKAKKIEEKKRTKPKPKIVLQTKLPVSNSKDPDKIQTSLNIITTEKILGNLSKNWVNLSTLISRLRIFDMLDAKYVQIKLRELTRRGTIEMQLKNGNRYWRLI